MILAREALTWFRSGRLRRCNYGVLAGPPFAHVRSLWRSPCGMGCTTMWRLPFNNRAINDAASAVVASIYSKKREALELKTALARWANCLKRPVVVNAASCTSAGWPRRHRGRLVNCGTHVYKCRN